MKKVFKLLTVMSVLTSIMLGATGCGTAKSTSGTAAGTSNGTTATTSAKPTNRLEAIKQRGTLEVATEPAFAPFEFIDPTKKGSEQYVGSDMKLAQYIADKLGVKLKVIPLEFGAVLSSITEGKYDMAISALSYTPARAEAMNMSKGYYFSQNNAGHGLLIRKADEAVIKSAESLADKVVVVQSGSLQELFATQQIPKKKDMKRVSSTTDGFLMVQEGKADASVTSIPTAQLYIDANPNAGLMVVKGFEFKQDETTLGTRIGMPKGEKELTDKVNQLIDEVIKSGDFEKWHTEYTEYAKKLGVK